MHRAIRILVIHETNQELAQLLGSLEDAFQDAEIVQVGDQEAYEQALAAESIDVVITEISLGWTQGFDVLRELHAQLPGVPVIMVTGSGSEALAVKAMKSGFADYVAKQDLGRLPDAVRASLHPSTEADRTVAPPNDFATSQQSATSLIRAFPEGVVLCNQEGHVVQMNAIAEHLLGYTFLSQDRTLAGQLRRVITCWENGELVIDDRMLPHRRALDGTTTDNVILSWLPRGHHERRWYSTRAAPVFDTAGHVTAALWTFTNVTDLVKKRKAEDRTLHTKADELESLASELEAQATEMEAQNAELDLLRVDLEIQVEERTAELREILDKYRTLFEVFPLGISISDSEGRVVETNRESEQLLGLIADEHRSRHVDSGEWEIVRPDGTPLPPEEYASTRALRNQEVVRDVEMGVRRPDGDTVWLNVTAAPLLDSRVVIAYADITKRKQAEARLVQYTAELETLNTTNRILLQEVNHRVKNTLTAILGLILSEKSRLEKEAPSRSEPMRCQTALSSLYERVQSLATVHGLLSSGLWRPLRADVLVDEIIRESVPYAVADSGNLVLEVTGKHVFVTPEQAHHLALIIGELTTNTVKHGWRGGKLQISVDVGLVEGDVRLVYRNSGPGYPDHILNGEGYSVGLSIVNGIATHSLRGTWAVRNDGGPVTEIRFPMHEQQSRRDIDEQ